MKNGVAFLQYLVGRTLSASAHNNDLPNRGKLLLLALIDPVCNGPKKQKPRLTGVCALKR
jgi:hypothetical protein